ncbi:MAG: hypothetical protein HYZ28_21140 [Myxococcales bacterium]|nr:hypothetical protein [Myxococcales bacterium]
MAARPNDELSELFRDVVLVLGGVFAVRKTDDETVCQVARGLDRAYRRARKNRSGGGAASAAGPGTALAPHPAIAGLLRLIDTEEDPR